MGKSDKYGKINIVTDQPFAIPGEEVRGKIYVHLKKKYPANKIKLEISGKEKCKWYEQKTRTVQDGDQMRMETYEVKYDTKKEFLEMKETIHKFKDDIDEGDYIFEFALMLPKNCPSSTYYTGAKKSEAFIKYKLKAKFEAEDGAKADDLKDDTFLVVRERADSINMNLKAQEHVDIKKCLCCCSMGQCTIDTWFERNVYTTDEIAQAVVSVDSSNCSGAAKIVMQVKQKIELRAEGQRYQTTNVVLRQEFGVVQPHEKIENKNVALNLKNIKAKVYLENKSVDSDVDDLQDQMKHMAESIQPTCTGH